MWQDLPSPSGRKHDEVSVSLSTDKVQAATARREAHLADRKFRLERHQIHCAAVAAQAAHRIDTSQTAVYQKLTVRHAAVKARRERDCINNRAAATIQTWWRAQRLAQVLAGFANTSLGKLLSPAQPGSSSSVDATHSSPPVPAPRAALSLHDLTAVVTFQELEEISADRQLHSWLKSLASAVQLSLRSGTAARSSASADHHQLLQHQCRAILSAVMMVNFPNHTTPLHQHQHQHQHQHHNHHHNHNQHHHNYNDDCNDHGAEIMIPTSDDAEHTPSRYPYHHAYDPMEHCDTDTSQAEAAAASAIRLVSTFERLLAHGSGSGRLRRFVGTVSLFSADMGELETNAQAKLVGVLGDELRQLVALRRSLDACGIGSDCDDGDAVANGAGAAQLHEASTRSGSCSPSPPMVEAVNNQIGNTRARLQELGVELPPDARSRPCSPETFVPHPSSLGRTSPICRQWRSPSPMLPSPPRSESLASPPSPPPMTSRYDDEFLPLKRHRASPIPFMSSRPPAPAPTPDPRFDHNDGRASPAPPTFTTTVQHPHPERPAAPFPPTPPPSPVEFGPVVLVPLSEQVSARLAAMPANVPEADQEQHQEVHVPQQLQSLQDVLNRNERESFDYKRRRYVHKTICMDFEVELPLKPETELEPEPELESELEIACAPAPQAQFEQLEHVVSGLVAHEIAMDPQYRLALPVDHARGLEFALLARRIARDASDSGAVAAVVADLRHGLLLATTAHSGSGHGRLRDRICSNLDPALLASQVMHGAFDQNAVFEFIIDIIQLVCAPARDHEVAELHARVHTVVPFLLLARSLLHRMHEDVLNYTLRNMRPALAEYAVEVERTTILPFFLGHGEDGEQQQQPLLVGEPHLHNRTRTWIARGCRAAGIRASHSEIAAEAVVELVTRHGSAAVDCPETCELDGRRIVAWRKTAALASLAASVHTIIRGAVPIGWGPRLVNDIMRSIVGLPEVAAATTQAEIFAPETLAAVAAASIALLQQYLHAVERAPRDFGWCDRLIRSLQETVDRETDHPVRSVLDQRVRLVLRTALVHGAVSDRVTPGLEASRGILAQMASELLVFYRHNYRVFGSLYGKIINGERRPPLQPSVAFVDLSSAPTHV